MMETQELLNSGKAYVESILTDDEDLLVEIENIGLPLDKLKIEHFEMETYAIWLEGTTCALSLSECTLGKR